MAMDRMIRTQIQKRRRPTPAPKLRWGWLEALLIAQTLLPALLFVPGVSKVRASSRVLAYAIGLIAWAVIAWRGIPADRADRFPARPWLIVAAVWLLILVAHPGTYSLKAGAAHALLYLSVLAPAFWAGTQTESPGKVGRLLAILFVCNALSASVGLAQVFRPKTFNPPVIPALKDKFGGEQLMYKTADGRKILRPCGLTDTPGAAAQAGMIAALIGMAYAARPGPWWRRIACAGLGFAGVAVIYYSQVRFTMVMLAIGFSALTVLLLWRGKVATAMLLAAGGLGALVGGFAWAARSVGWKAVERFGTLLSGDPSSVYQKSRGYYVVEAFDRYLWEYPLGMGLGWWGMVHQAFGDPRRTSPVWVEVMIPGWVIDGGFPLLIAYSGAIILALWDTARVALTSRDESLAFAASVVFALNLAIAAACFSYLPFVSSLGLQFWALAAAVHAADCRAVRRA
jgi:hypothetical protein